MDAPGQTSDPVIPATGFALTLTVASVVAKQPRSLVTVTGAQAGIATDRISGKVDSVTEGVKSLLHIVYAQKQQPQTCETVSYALQFFRILEDKQNTEDKKRHGIGGNLHLETETSH